MKTIRFQAKYIINARIENFVCNDKPQNCVLQGSESVAVRCTSGSAMHLYFGTGFTHLNVGAAGCVRRAWADEKAKTLLSIGTAADVHIGLECTVCHF